VRSFPALMFSLSLFTGLVVFGLRSALALLSSGTLVFDPRLDPFMLRGLRFWDVWPFLRQGNITFLRAALCFFLRYNKLNSLYASPLRACLAGSTVDVVSGSTAKRPFSTEFFYYTSSFVLFSFFSFFYLQCYLYVPFSRLRGF